jgi:glyoxylase-like metal-dependent hydrolase (beta-lactamase superfamily II)
VGDTHRAIYIVEAMWFRQLFDAESSTYTYLVGDDASDATLVIDPVAERVDDVLAALAGRRLVYTLDTHVHADHVTAGALLRGRTGAQVVLPALASDCGCADLTLADGDTLAVGALAVRALHTPGHTPESLSFLAGGQVFTGDALLVGTCGRTDFQGGDAGALYDAIHARLFTLPDDTLVWPAHDYQGRTHTTIGAEKRANVRLTGRSRDEFIALMASLHLPPPRKLDEAVPANRRCGLDRLPQGA